MMNLTKESICSLREQLKNKPLSKGEIRKIIGAGGMYVTLKRLESIEVHPGEELVEKPGIEYWFKYALRIDGTVYYFYAGLPIVEKD